MPEQRIMSMEVVGAAAQGGGGAALVTVIAATGSIPRHPGSKMLVPGTGKPVGTIGGGETEAMAADAAAGCIRAGRSRTLAVEMHGTEAQGKEMLCGGGVILLVEYIEEAAPYLEACRALETGRRVVFVKKMEGMAGGKEGSVSVALLEESGAAKDLATAVGFGSKEGLAVDGRTAALCAATGKRFFFEEAGIFYDPVLPPEKLLILGGGHVGRALASMAAGLDFAVTVVDDREEFADPGRFAPGVKTLCGGYAQTVGRFPFDSSTYVVIVTRGHLFDLECVRAVLGKTYRYAGFISSARKAKLLREQAVRDGFDKDSVEALRAPIGLSIAAETPAEIAVSIMAEIVSVRRNAGADGPRPFRS
jgi:xanthine dehydrogenase accessory factor